MNYPTLENVKTATRYQVCKWHRFLPSPINKDQKLISNSIHEKYKAFGGFTPEISKSIGW